MAWGNFLLIIAILYPAYYGIIFLIDFTKSDKKAESEEETFVLEDLEHEDTFLLEEEEFDFEVSPSSSNKINPLFETVEKPFEQQAKTEEIPSEFIDQSFTDFTTIQDQGIPVLEFRSKAKELASSFKF